MIQALIVLIIFTGLIAMLYFGFKNADLETKWLAIKSVLSLTFFGCIAATILFFIVQIF